MSSRSMDRWGVRLYRLLRESVRVPVGFAVVLRGVDLVKSLESSRDSSDAAYKQN